MTKSGAKFSIITPVYNTEKYLERCIKSILKQRYANFELICVNDASTDNSLEILKKWGNLDERIVVINNTSEHHGPGFVRNIALERVTGDYICCIDSDDWVENDFLTAFLNGFEYDVDSVWIKYWRYIEKIDVATLQINYPKFIHRLEGLIEINPQNINNFPAFPWNKCFKTELVKQNNVYWMPDVYFEDIYFTYDYLMKYNKVYLKDNLLYYYRNNGNSIVTSPATLQKRISDMFTVLSEINNLIDKKEYNKEFKQSLLKSAKNYYKQYEKSEYAEEIAFSYQKFLSEIEN